MNIIDKKRIAITGAGGYLGGHLLRRFCELGHTVVPITRRDCDLRSPQQVQNFFSRQQEKFDVLIHAASVGGSRNRVDDPGVCYQNLVMYKNIIQHYDSDYDRLVLLLSGARQHAIKRKEPYGLSHDMIYRTIYDDYDIKIFNIWNIFGVQQLSTRFIRSNMERYYNKKPMIIHDNIRFDFFYIDDFFHEVRKVVQNPQIRQCQEINCVYRTSYTLEEIAKMINELDQHKVQIQIVGDMFGCHDYNKNYFYSFQGDRNLEVRKRLQTQSVSYRSQYENMQSRLQEYYDLLKEQYRLRVELFQGGYYGAGKWLCGVDIV